MFKFIGKLLDSNEREIKRFTPVVDQINALEKDFEKIPTEKLATETEKLKKLLAKGETLDSILPEAFALVREGAKRTLGMRHFDVQLISAIALHQGNISEQKTGEGKTLSATPALYLNALLGKGVHLVTVNDYLARRDAGWMGPLFHSLGISVAAIIHDQSFIFDPEYEDPQAADPRLKNLRPISRKEAYLADVTYGINSEFGFDYLRDNMEQRVEGIRQREFYFAVVDEVDSVLIDEARTPHIISAPDEEPTQKYYEYAKIVDQLVPKQDFEVDEKLRTAHLTEHGIGKIEKIFNLPNIYERDFQTVHHLEAALKARTLYHREKEYIVRDNQVIIVDEFTGRLMPGRRFSEGIHQAIEAKENVTIQRESKTLATVSLQNYFRMYEKLAGMTGTAVTEAEEFHKIYKLEVVVIPTHRSMVREDLDDIVYKTTRAKYAAIVREIEEAHKKGQPVLVGTTSIDKNEIISQFLKRKGITHNVLNAKNHEKEAEIIANAGRLNAVTVATNMAGRGVDIILGGQAPEKSEMSEKEYEKAKKEWQKAHDEVLEAGGLYVMGTERHESRRIDNQLRGRSGRQGDPGKSRFFVSLEDDIMRLFGGDRIASLMTMFKLPEDQPLEHGMVSRAIEQAQTKVEGFNFDIRKHLVEYDDVMNKQREIVYKLRRRVLTDKEYTKKEVEEKIATEIEKIVVANPTELVGENANEKIVAEFATIIPFDEASQKNLVKQLEQEASIQAKSDFLINLARDLYTKREEQLTADVLRSVEQAIFLGAIDSLWTEHLDAIDDLREGVGLRGYAQKDPLVEYKNEAFNLFERLVAAIDSEIVYRIYKVEVITQPHQHVHQVENVPTSEISTDIKKQSKTPAASAKASPEDASKNLGRNDPCWCGSGKKWKKCHYPQTSA